MKRLLLLVWLALGSGCPGPGWPLPDGGSTDGGTDGGGENCPAAAPNLLPNPGFECGTQGWITTGAAVLATEEGGGRSGKRAARLTASSASAAANLWLGTDAVVSPGTRTFCARGWMRGTAADGRLTLAKSSQGTLVNETFSSPVTQEWVLVPPSTYGPLKVVGANEERILFRVWIPNPTAGSYLVIDDLELWESAQGDCKER